MKSFAFWTLLAGSFLLPGISCAEEPAGHPIDKFLESCIERDSTTSGMINCTDEAYDMWDQELNSTYKKLRTKLSPEGRQVLKTAQLEWIKYRDKEFRLIDEIYSQLEGTMFIPMRAAERMSVVKQRAVELKEYENLLVNLQPGNPGKK